MQFTTVYITVLSEAGEGWLHSSHGKVQPCWRRQSCSRLHHQRNWSFVLSSLQLQGVLLLACLIASLIKTWLALSNMISPSEHLQLSQQLCVCVLCTSWAAKMYGSGSGCRESEHTAAAQVLWLCRDVPVPSSSPASLRGYPSIAGRTEHTGTHLLQCQVQQPDLVTRSPGVCASETVFCFHFLNALLNIQIFPKTALLYNFRAGGCIVELRDGLSRVFMFTRLSVPLKSIKVILHF